jgi:hypothetical protein
LLKKQDIKVGIPIVEYLLLSGTPDIMTPPFARSIRYVIPSIAKSPIFWKRRKMDKDGEHAERVPFLDTAEWAPSTDGDDIHQHGRSPSALYVTLAVSALILLADVVASVPVAPRMVIFEDIICRNYYAASENGQEIGNCKIGPVQSELALINGWKETFDTIPGKSCIPSLSIRIVTGRTDRHVGFHSVWSPGGAHWAQEDLAVCDDRMSPQ